ncbi:MAG: hypothetical protein ACLFPA_11790 [Dichotomicrobium sp.]
MYSRELIESLFILPYTRVTDLVEKGLGHRNTVSRYMKELERIGVVIRLKEGREVLYINHKFLDLLAID